MGNPDAYTPQQNEIRKGLALDRSKWLPTEAELDAILKENGARKKIEEEHILESLTIRQSA